jgi:hypothetical protein
MKSKKIASAVVAAALATSMVPATALAANPGATTETTAAQETAQLTTLDGEQATLIAPKIVDKPAEVYVDSFADKHIIYVQSDYPSGAAGGYDVEVQVTNLDLGYTRDDAWRSTLEADGLSYGNIYGISLDWGFTNLVEPGYHYSVKFRMVYSDYANNNRDAAFSEWVDVPGVYYVSERSLTEVQNMYFQDGYLYIEDNQSGVSFYDVSIAPSDWQYGDDYQAFETPEKVIYIGDALKNLKASDSYSVNVLPVSNDTSIARTGDSYKTITISPTQEEIAGYTNGEGVTGNTGGAGNTGAETVSPFTDVYTTDWYANNVAFVSAAGYMNGLGGAGSTTFAPNQTLTRSMMAQVLYNIAGEKTSVDYATTFRDISGTNWYNDAISWAYVKGYITGYDNGAFGVEDSVTREQVAAILWRFAGSPKVEGNLSGFSDGASVSSYATDALVWATQAGIMQGSSGALDPARSATRAEIAAMVQRYMSL